jgi:signal transduction histidine kinase
LHPLRPDGVYVIPPSANLGAIDTYLRLAALERRVAERTRQVRELTTSLVRAEQGERRRLSETLHDELQQLLYGIQLKIRLARDELLGKRPEEAEQQLVQADSLLARSTRVTRQLSVDLNPPILRNEGLKSILQWLRGQMKELHGLEVALETEGEVRIEDGDVRVLLFRVFRELLFNVAKHAEARSASVSMRELDGHVVVEVADDGKGFDVARIEANDGRKPTVGLTSVRERVGLLGGRIEIASQPGVGTRVKVRLPASAKIGG